MTTNKNVTTAREQVTWESGEEHGRHKVNSKRKGPEAGMNSVSLRNNIKTGCLELRDPREE